MSDNHIHSDLIWHSGVIELGHLGSGDGLSPFRRQIIARTNAKLLLNEPLKTNLIEIRVKIQ